MTNEFAPDHFDVWVQFRRGPGVESVARAVERVACGMSTDKCFAGLNGVEECLFAFGSHRWVTIAARVGQITGRVEEKGVVLGKVLPSEHAAIFRSGDLES